MSTKIEKSAQVASIVSAVIAVSAVLYGVFVYFDRFESRLSHLDEVTTDNTMHLESLQGSYTALTNRFGSIQLNQVAHEDIDLQSGGKSGPNNLISYSDDIACVVEHIKVTTEHEEFLCSISVQDGMYVFEVVDAHCVARCYSVVAPAH